MTERETTLAEVGAILYVVPRDIEAEVHAVLARLPEARPGWPRPLIRAGSVAEAVAEARAACGKFSIPGEASSSGDSTTRGLSVAAIAARLGPIAGADAGSGRSAGAATAVGTGTATVPGPVPGAGAGADPGKVAGSASGTGAGTGAGAATIVGTGTATFPGPGAGAGFGKAAGAGAGSGAGAATIVGMGTATFPGRDASARARVGTGSGGSASAGAGSGSGSGAGAGSGTDTDTGTGAGLGSTAGTATGTGAGAVWVAAIVLGQDGAFEASMTSRALRDLRRACPGARMVLIAATLGAELVAVLDALGPRVVDRTHIRHELAAAVLEQAEAAERERFLETLPQRLHGLDLSLRKKAANLEALFEIADAMQREHELDPILHIIISDVTRVLDAERSTLYVYDEERQLLISKIAQSVGKDEPPITVKLGQGIAGWAAATRETINVPDAHQDPRFNPYYDRLHGYRTRAVLAVPLLTKDGRLIGVIQVLNKFDPEGSGGYGEFTADDESLLRTFSLQAATAIDNVRSYDSRVRQEALDRELKLAAEIQRRFLPEHAPVVPGYEVEAHTDPCYEIGGDFYEFATRPNGAVVLAIGDISGKGIGAGLMLANFQAVFSLLVRSELDPAEIVQRANRSLCATSIHGRFLTLVYAELDPATGLVRYVNCGHNRPLLVRAPTAADRGVSYGGGPDALAGVDTMAALAGADTVADGSGPDAASARESASADPDAETWRGPGRQAGPVLRLPAGGPLLGVIADAAYRVAEVTLGPGDLLFLYTDGITEARGPEKGAKALGEEGLLDVLRRSLASAERGLVREILDRFTRFTGGRACRDDVTFVALRRTQAPQPLLPRVSDDDPCTKTTRTSLAEILALRPKAPAPAPGAAPAPEPVAGDPFNRTTGTSLKEILAMRARALGAVPPPPAAAAPPPAPPPVPASRPSAIAPPAAASPYAAPPPTTMPPYAAPPAPAPPAPAAWPGTIAPPPAGVPASASPRAVDAVSRDATIPHRPGGAASDGPAERDEAPLEWFMRIDSRSEALADLRAFAREFLGRARVPSDLVPRIVLAIDEACSNVIRHAYAGAPGRPIDVLLRVDVRPEPRLEVTVKDEGERRPDLAKIAARPLGRCEPGGYGSQFICAIMDEVEYDVSAPVGTTLRMVKRLKALSDRLPSGAPGERPW